MEDLWRLAKGKKSILLIFEIVTALTEFCYFLIFANFDFVTK